MKRMVKQEKIDLMENMKIDENAIEMLKRVQLPEGLKPIKTLSNSKIEISILFESYVYNNIFSFIGLINNILVLGRYEILNETLKNVQYIHIEFSDLFFNINNDEYRLITTGTISSYARNIFSHNISITGEKDGKSIMCGVYLINNDKNKYSTITALRNAIGSSSKINANGYNEDIGNILQVVTTNQTNLLIFVGALSDEGIASTDISDLAIEDIVRQVQ